MEYQGFPTAEERLAKQTSDPDMPRALLFGLVAGAAGAAAWYALVAITHWQIGILAIVIGGLVGTAAVRGAGGKYGPQLQILSVAITLAAMVVAEYFIVRAIALAYLEKQYGTGASGTVPLFLPLDLAWDFVTAGIKDDPLTLVFWGLAVWTAFRVPRAPKLVEAPAPAATPPGS